MSDGSEDLSKAFALLIGRYVDNGSTIQEAVEKAIDGLPPYMLPDNLRGLRIPSHRKTLLAMAGHLDHIDRHAGVMAMFPGWEPEINKLANQMIDLSGKLRSAAYEALKRTPADPRDNIRERLISFAYALDRLQGAGESVEGEHDCADLKKRGEELRALAAELVPLVLKKINELS